MKLKIENFGKIKSADLELEGLTLIAGQNDTGKSTVGKIIFWLINDLNNYKEQYNQFLIVFCKYRVVAILKYLARKDYKLPENLKQFIDVLSTDDKLFKSQYEYLDSKVIDYAKQTLEFIEQKNIMKDNVVQEEFGAVKSLLEASDELKIAIILSLTRSDIFKGALNNSVYSNIKAKISFETIDTNVFAVQIDNEQVIDVHFNKDKIKILWSNVDFIETPLMIDKKDYNSSEDKKWIKKFNDSRKKIKDKDSFFISNEIHDIIDGDISISDDDLYYQKNKTSKKLHIMNAASGAKSFVILDLLNKFGNFKSDSITVFDEPENHLHPEWQVKYAELVVDFVQKGANIVLTSHSPYMIKALKFYINEKKLDKDRYRFLLAEKTNEENWSVIKDVTKETYKIFKLLRDPIYKVTSEE